MPLAGQRLVPIVEPDVLLDCKHDMGQRLPVSGFATVPSIACSVLVG